MANTDKDILITPNRGSSNEPKIEFKGASSSVGPSTITATIYPTNNGTLSFDGTEGQLFSIANNLTTGSIFSVNPISGIPIIDVNADRTIALNPYGGNTGIGLTNPSYKLDVNGTARFSGQLTIPGDNSITFGPNSTWSRYLRIGGNGWAADSTTASIVTTDGNLHLDAADANHGIYLNWYGGTNGTFFGNGAAGQIGRLDGSGNFSVSGTITGTQITSTIANGTAPFVVSSTTKVTNLNADYLDDQTGSYYRQAWQDVDSGTRTNYTLGFQPPANGYAGFYFSKSTSGSTTADAGYLLIRGSSDSDVYTAEGITLVADAGWLTLAQRTTASRGVRIMSGTTSAERIKVTTDGDIQFVNGASFTYNGNTIWHAGNDGAGSGLDADLIDGVQFNNSNNTNQVSAPDSLNSNGIGYVTNISLYGQTDGALYSQAYSSAWQHQIYGDYRTGQIAIRGKNSNTWQSWRTVWDSGNFAPSDYKRSNDQNQVNINTPASSDGAWTTASSNDEWGNPKFDGTFNEYRYADAPAWVQYNIPAGMKSAWISQLTWSIGGYVDIHGVQSGGQLVFLRRINTRQTVENTDEGVNHDGSTITFAASGLDDYAAIRFTVQSGRFHLTGLSFSSADNEGTEGVGMVHPAQISHQGAGSGLDADTVDGLNPSTSGTSNIVSRDASGNFSAGTITAALNGNASSATIVNGTSGQNIAKDDRIIEPNSITSGRLQFGFTSWANNDTSPYADYLHLRSYTDGSGGSDNLVMFRKDAIGMRIYQQSFGSGDAYSSYADVALSTGATFTGQIQSTKANDTATGGGQIYLNGATGNRIDFNQAGVAAPAFTTRSVGTKIVLYPSLGVSNVDYAFGIDNSTLWSSIPETASHQFKWYAGTTNIATLSGGGNLTVTGEIQGTIFKDYNDTNYYADFGNTGTSIVTAGNIGAKTTSPLQALDVRGNFLLAADSTTATHITQKPYTVNGGTLSWEGSAGQLFSITNNLTSGSIFSVNDVSGLPSIDVDANGTILFAPYGGNIGVGTLIPTQKLHVVGSSIISGTLGLGVDSALAKLHTRVSTPTSIGSLPSGVTGILDSSSNNYLLFRNTADNGTYSGIAMQDNNVGGYVIFGNSGGGGDLLYVAGYGGGQLQYGTADSINPSARTTVASWNSTGLQINNGDLRAPIFYDTDNTNYYLDPASGSVLNYATFANNNALYFSSTSTAEFNHNSNSTPVAFAMIKSGSSFSDGDNFGVLNLRRLNHNNGATTAGSSLFFELKDSGGTVREYAGITGRKTEAGAAGGQLDFHYYGRNVMANMNSSLFQHITSVRAPIFYDSDDTNYYLNPATDSFLRAVTIRDGGLKLERAYANNSIWFVGGTDDNHVLWNDHHGGPGARGGAGSGFDGMKWNTYKGIYFRTGYGGQYNSLEISGSGASTNDHQVYLYGANDEKLRTVTTDGIQIQRDLYISGSAGGNYGNRLIVGNTDTVFTLQDTNLRPTIQAHGPYPVVSLNHTVTSNGSHGPTLQFTCNGTGNQFVIGTNGTGTFLSMGYSSAGDWNPHNGIAGHNGTSFFHANSSGNIGLGAGGDWGPSGGGDPGYNLHFVGSNNGTNGHAAFFDNRINGANNGSGFLFRNQYGNHSWGIVAEYRVEGASGADRPSILFSTGYNSNTWSVGYGSGSDDNFRINYDHGHRNNSWGTTAVLVDRSSIMTVSGEVRAPIFRDSDNTDFYLNPASTTTSLQIAGAIEQGNNFAHPNIEWSYAGNSTGRVVFKLPGNSGNYGMVHMVFDYYEYNSPRTATIIVSGHNWNGAWYNTACNVVGYIDKPVYLGFIDGQYCVAFGDFGSSWNYATIRLRKIHNASFYNNIMDLGGTYTATQITSGTFTNISSDLRRLMTSNAMYAYEYRGHSNVAGTGEATYHPAGVYSTGTNWLYGSIITNNNSINAGTANIDAAKFRDSDNTTYEFDGTGITRLNTLRVFSNSGADWDAIQISTDGVSGYIQGLGDETGLRIRSQQGNILLADDRGSVGINNTLPLQKLDVRGNFLLAADSTTATHITQKPYTVNGGTLSWEGSEGQLFSIANNLTTGSIFSVNPISGIPIIDVNADRTIALNPYGGNTGIGLTNPSYKLDVNGTTRFSGASIFSSNISLSNGYIRAITNNQPAILSVASGTASSQASFAIQQETAEGWTGIFVDFEPYTGWGLYHDNPNNYFCVTSESSTGSLRSFTVPSRSSGNRTAYEKIRFDQNNGNLISGGEIQGTIFRDVISTSYYVDPASTSNIDYLQINDRLSLVKNRSHFTGVESTSSADGRSQIILNSYYSDVVIASQQINGNHGSTLSFTAVNPSDSGDYRKFVINQGNWTGSHLLRFGWADAAYTNPHTYVAGTFGSGYDVLGLDGVNRITYAFGEVRAPIFRDSNDPSNYYVDPNGTSRIDSIYIVGGVAGVSNSSAYHEAAIEVRERGFGGAQDDTWATAPRIGFHWGGRVASQIALASNGRISILNNPGNAYENFQCNDAYVNSVNLPNGFQISQGGSNYGVFNSWVRLDGTYGFYAPSHNNAHFYPNDASYGAWRISGSRNGWCGIHFDTGSTLMMNSSTVGFHREGAGWQMRWDAGTGYISKGNPGGGTDAIILDTVNYSSHAPTLTGTGASGTWGINITGTASGLPTYYIGGQQTNPQTYFGQSVGLRVAMTGFPSVWADTLWINGYAGGDVLQMCALHTLRNGQPRMYISAQASNATSYGTTYEFLTTYNYNSHAPTLTGTGASGTWGINITGNANTATNLSTTRANWGSNGTITAVVGQLSWRNYGNNHTIFDASASTSPDGGSVNNTNPDYAWSATYPTLMGWNGANTYGVRVDSARISDSTSSLALTTAVINSSAWAGGSSYHGYTYSGGNYRFGFSSSSGVVDVYADGNFYATDSSHLVWHAGNDGAGSGLDADLLDGLQLHTGRNNEVNKVVRTDDNGYIQAGWINTISGDLGVGTRLDRVYCSNDAYVRYLGLTDFKNQMGLSSKNNYSRRVDYTSDSNYWVGSFGHSGYGADETFHGGSGFFDIWSGTNYPSGLTHIHGINMLHYTTNSLGSTGGNAYGWQLAAQYNTNAGPYWRRCSGGGFSSWMQLWHDTNDGSGSGLDADLLDGIHASSFARNDIYNSVNAGFQVSRNIGSISGSWEDGNHTLSLENGDGGNIVLNFHRGGYSSNNLRYDGTTFNFDATITVAGSASLSGNLTVSTGNATGGGIILGDDGDIVDLNDGYCAMRFSSGVRIHSGNRTGSAVITLGSNGNVTASAFYGDGSNLTGITAGATLSASSGSQRVVLTSLTSGTMTSAATSSALTFDSSTGTLSSTVFTSTSDITKKTNIHNITNAVNLTKQINGVKFDWKETGESSAGVIAQEVEEILPEIVHTNDEGIKSVNYNGVVGLLIEAIKEQQNQIDELKKELKKLYK